MSLLWGSTLDTRTDTSEDHNAVRKCPNCHLHFHRDDMTAQPDGTRLCKPCDAALTAHAWAGTVRLLDAVFATGRDKSVAGKVR